MLYKKKSEINKKSKEATINLIPDDQFERNSLETDRAPGASEAEDGFSMIQAELDKTFKYDDQVSSF